MAGYSATPLLAKLGIRDSHVVFLDALPAEDPLDGLADFRTLGAGGAPHVVRRLPAAADVTLTFQTDATALARRLPVLVERTTTAGMVWVCWPKKAAQRSARNPDGPVSDLDENVVRTLALATGVVDVKVAAVDATWSGLKLVRRLTDR
ncbi:MAG: DUF3052 domain-containing protein [Nocardioides sp.]